MNSHPKLIAGLIFGVPALFLLVYLWFQPRLPELRLSPFPLPSDRPIKNASTITNISLNQTSPSALFRVPEISPGLYQIHAFGSTRNINDVFLGLYLDDKKISISRLEGGTSQKTVLQFRLKQTYQDAGLSIRLEPQDKSNSVNISAITLHKMDYYRIPPKTKSLTDTGAYFSGNYRNLFLELGYTANEVRERIEATYQQLFHHPDKKNKSIFIPVDSDMAYIWDTGYNDVRSEGISYGMMIAVQMNRQDDFNKLWKWAYTHSYNKSGPMKGYFAWQISREGHIMDANPATDAEEFFVTALFFASHRWGDGEGVFDYAHHANRLLENMYFNGETRPDTKDEKISLFDHKRKLVVFSPAIPEAQNWTAPAYHLPAFYELWARWANKHNDFWAELAVQSRQFWKTTVHPKTGLTPDYAYFDGSPHSAFRAPKSTFQYDAWRTISHAALDYSWWNKDPWQVQWANQLLTFFHQQGHQSYPALFYLDGTVYNNSQSHSLGLIAMNGMASLAADEELAWDFVQHVWDQKTPEGRYRYYDGSLYLFALLALSGKYKIYCPNTNCQ